jgi:hypothetical protein
VTTSGADATQDETRAAAAAPPPPIAEEPRTPEASLPVFDEPPAKTAETLPAPVEAVDIPGLAEEMAKRLIAVHPQPGLPQRVRPRIEGILRAAADPAEAAERIWNNHRAWRDYWARLEAGRFIPQLWRWFDEREWENAPVIRRPAEKASFAERCYEYGRRMQAAAGGKA